MKNMDLSIQFLMNSRRWGANRMLVLTRRRNESIIINDNIEVSVIDVQNDQVRIGITAPKDVSIYRKELYIQILEENKKAVENQEVSLDELKKKLEG